MYGSAYRESSYGLDRSPADYHTQSQRNNTFELESRISSLVTENEKLNLDLRDRYNEVQTWKTRCETFERNHKLAMEDLTVRLERQKLMEIDEAIAKTNSRFNSDVSSIQNQARFIQETLKEYENKNRTLTEDVNRLSRTNQDLAAEVDQWKMKYANLEKTMHTKVGDMRLSSEMRTRDELEMATREYNARIAEERKTYENQMRSVRQTVADMENKLRSMASESERFNTIIAEKNQEIEILKGKFVNLEKFKSQEVNDVMSRLEHEKRDIIERELKSQALMFADERNRFEGNMKEISQHIMELEKQMIYLTSERERLQRLLDDKTREAETLKVEFIRMEDTKNLELRNVHQQFEVLKRNAMSATDMEGRYHAERAALDAEIMQHRQKAAELDGHVRNLAQENEKLTQSYYELQRESEALKMKKNRPDASLEGEVEALRRENDKLRGLGLEGNELRVRFDVEKENYETQIAQLRQVLQVNKAEIEKLYHLVDVRRQENEHLTIQFNEARAEIAKMDNICKEMDSRYAILTNKYEQLGKEAQSLQRSRDLFKHQIERGNMEIAMKNRELQERIKEVDMLKMRYEESINNFRADHRL